MRCLAPLLSLDKVRKEASCCLELCASACAGSASQIDHTQTPPCFSLASLVRCSLRASNSALRLAASSISSFVLQTMLKRGRMHLTKAACRSSSGALSGARDGFRST